MSLNGNNVIGSSGHRTNQPPYEIDQSLRLDGFPGTTNQHLERSPSSSGNRKTFTISFWHKPSLFAKAESDHYIKVKPSASEQFQVSKNASTDTFLIYIEVGNTGKSLTTTRVFRDPSSWYHFVIAVDTTQATASNRVKLYVNGVQETDFGTEQYPDQNWETCYNQSGVNQDLLWSREDSGRSPSGYFAEWHSIDGTALDASSFGETNADTNQWVPIKYAGSYGTNGFYLKFQDSSALGDDSSGNTNDFTPTNLAATDQVLDSPTNNFATLNPLASRTSGSSSITLSEGNLKISIGGTGDTDVPGTIPISSGKWYAEVYAVTFDGSNTGEVGITESGFLTNQTYVSSTPKCTYLYSGRKRLNGSSTSTYGASWSSGDIVGIALNLDDNEITFYKNNSSQGAISITADEYVFTSARGSGTPVLVWNFGQDSSFAGNKTSGAAGSDFYYAPPTGFVALCSDNLSDPSIADPTAHFDTTLVSGNGSNRSITGLNFQPDFLWGKSRTNTLDHYLTDSVRGVTKQLYSNRYIAENSETVIYTAFNSDGFSLGTGDMNLSGQNYVHWAWKGGGTASSNTDGSITSSVSANTDAGFSIVGWAGTGSNVTVGHGLSQAPELIINKSRTLNTSSSQWAVQSILWNSASDTNMLYLNGTGAASDDTNVFQAAPTATVFSPQGGGWVGIGASGENYIAYCFHSVEGYSKVGKYTGNSNADGPMFYCGFKPSWAMFKAIDSIQSWTVFDNKRNVYNLMDNSLFPDLNNVENDATSLSIDFVSNGIKIRSAHNYVNYSGSDYLVLAFAESPFKTSNAR